MTPPPESSPENHPDRAPDKPQGKPQGKPRISLLALPEASGSTLYGLYDVFSAVGGAWPAVTGEPRLHPGFAVEIVAPRKGEFRAHGGVPVAPHAALSEVARTDVIVVPDINLNFGEDPRGRWPEAAAWLADRHARGATVCTVCTGTILAADSGLLDGLEATTHWAATGLFDAYFPKVELKPERVLVHGGNDQRIVTTGGAASWEDLALYLIGRFCGPEEAVRIAKLFLFGDRSDGQLAYAAMPRPRHHEDAAVADCQAWLADHYAAANPVARMVARSGLAERTFKRRFRAATGYAPVEYVQTLRIEEAKQLLETTAKPTDEIGAAVGYDDPAFFRKLFKRRTGITPARYRQKFRFVTGVEGGGGKRV